MSNEDRPRRVCTVLVDRANYGRLKPVMRSVQNHPRLQLQVIAAGTMLLDRFDRPVEVVRRDGFEIDSEVFIELEGSQPETMAKSVGFGLIEFAGEFRRLKPDIVLLIGDRYEALAAAIAAAYMNLCIVHIQGGEVSGSIDESARHAITKFAHYHCPSTVRSARYIERMGEDPATILQVGCPSSDLARQFDGTLDPEILNSRGSGCEIDVTQPFNLVIFHPTTTDYRRAAGQVEELLEALRQINMQTVLLWPNIDAGSGQVHKAIRRFRDHHATDWLRTLINLNPNDYLKVLASATCAVGNSSSFVRDAGFFGTPVVLVGDRQIGREAGAHLIRVSPDCEAIEQAILTQIKHGRYEPCTLYGDGYVADRIADSIAQVNIYMQKTLHYVFEPVDGEPTVKKVIAVR